MNLFLLLLQTVNLPAKPSASWFLIGLFVILNFCLFFLLIFLFFSFIFSLLTLLLFAFAFACFGFFRSLGFFFAMHWHYWHSFEQVELTVPLGYLASGGANVHVIAPDWIGDQVASCEYARAVNW